MINVFRFLRGVLLALSLGACSYLPSMPSMPKLSSLRPYVIDVQQGNVSTQEMVSSLKPGMSKDQVKFILGTPLLTDMFHSDRWDYVYRLQPGQGQPQERHFTLYFEKDALVRIEGDVVSHPHAPPPVAATPTVAPTAAEQADAAPKVEERKGFFARLWEKLGF